MKKQLGLLCLVFFAISGKAQNVSVEKSIYGIQAGVLGIWIHNESRIISNNTVLRSEVGFDGGIWDSAFHDEVGLVMTPVLTIEPRIYYNLEQRSAKGKNISNNSGNFIALNVSYRPDWVYISTYEDDPTVSSLSFIPTWGLRRSVGKKGSFEAGIGMGYRYYFAKRAGYSENEGHLAFNLLVRIGLGF